MAIWSHEIAGEKLCFHFQKNKTFFKSSRCRTYKIRYCNIRSCAESIISNISIISIRACFYSPIYLFLQGRNEALRKAIQEYRRVWKWLMTRAFSNSILFHQRTAPKLSFLAFCSAYYWHKDWKATGPEQFLVGRLDTNYSSQIWMWTKLLFE